MIIDEGAKKIIDNVIKEDDILNENITSECLGGSEEPGLMACEILKGLRRRGNRSQIRTPYTSSLQNLILWIA